MENGAKLLKNTLVLAGSNIILRLCALLFQAYLASEIGPEQLGLFGIVSSVGVVFATVAISGVRFGVTRLVAEECGTKNPYPRSLMRWAFLYALVFGSVSGITLFLTAEVLSSIWVMNLSATLPLRVMALSMPLVSLGAVAEGYFTAKQKIVRLVGIQLFSQLARVCFVCIYLGTLRSDETSCLNVLATGSFIGEAFLSIGILTIYFFESSGKKERTAGKRYMSALIKTSLPLAVSAYMRTGLSSLGQVIIPRGLRRSGMNADSAFVTYGVIGQMTFPVIMFPAALLNALGEILVPRLTKAQVNGKKIGISYIVNRALRIGIIFSFGIMGIMFFYANSLGESIYNSAQAGRYIRIFAPLVPIIYIDCVTDGCLKGLGQQLHSMMYNVMEGLLNVTLLMLLLPKMAIGGYIVVMYIKEIFNAVLSVRRLSKVTEVDKNISVIACCIISSFFAFRFSEIVLIDQSVWLCILLYLFFYTSLLYVLNAVSRGDIKWVASLVKNEEKQKKTVCRC